MVHDVLLYEWPGRFKASELSDEVELGSAGLGLDSIEIVEDGESLSVGEWQRVAVARALARPAPFLVLDEPTSAMDAPAERELVRRFHEVTEGRTALVISHRLSTVRLADRVVVLEAGRVVQSGTHDELVGRDGTYAELFAELRGAPPLASV